MKFKFEITGIDCPNCAAKLAKMPFGSSEASVIHNYLDVCLELPWQNYTEDRLDVTLAQKILDEDHDGITKVKKSGEELADTARKAQSAADAAATDSMNSVGAVSREAARAVTQTGDAVKSVGDGIKLAATEAGKVSNAFGKAVPVVGQLGSAISAAITGPIGAISAVIGLAYTHCGVKGFMQVLDTLDVALPLSC